jgi:predicted nucleic acid-binding protein
VKYVLDTDVLSAARRADRMPRVRAWLAARADDEMFLSVITLGEIARDIVLQDRRNPDFAADLRVWLDRTTQLFADRILPFGAPEARIWGRLSAQIGHPGADLMIAATALHHGATVATGNTADFAPTGVALCNPFDG